MVRLISLLKIDKNYTDEIIQQLRQIPQIKTIHSITGEYDVMIELETERSAILADLFTQKIDPIQGILQIHSHYIMKSWNK